MATINKNLNSMPMPSSMERMEAGPLDKTSVYYDLTTLQEYAQNNVTAYVGQILSLVDETNNTVTLYYIKDSDGSVEKIGMSNSENQNTFSTIQILKETGDVDVEVTADSTTDTLQLKGTNIGISADATNDIITFKVNDATTGQKGVVELVDSITEDTYKVPHSKAIKSALAAKADGSALSDKINVVKQFTAGNLTTLTSTGHIQDSGKSISDFILDTDVSSEYNNVGTAPVNGKAIYGALSTLNIQNGKSSSGQDTSSSYQKSEKTDTSINLEFFVITERINSLLSSGNLGVDDITPLDKNYSPITITTTDSSGNTILNIGKSYDRTIVGVTSATFGTSIATGKRSFSAGSSNAAINEKSFAVGCDNYAAGLDSFAANYANFARGQDSAAFGSSNLALGNISFTVGTGNIAYGDASFTSGTGTIAYGTHSFTAGNNTIAVANNQAVFGKFNRTIDTEEGALFIVGNGEGECRSNAMEVTKDGHIKVYHRDLTANTTDVTKYLDISHNNIKCQSDSLLIYSPYQVTLQSTNLVLQAPNGGIELSSNTNPIEFSTTYLDIKTLGGVKLNSKKIYDLADPSDDNDAANKKYVDNKIGYATSVPTTATEIAQGPEFLVIIEE